MQLRTCRVVAWAAVLLALSACTPMKTAETPAAPAAMAAPASAPAVMAAPAAAPLPPVVDPADLAARRFLAYHEQIRQMQPSDLANEVARLTTVVSATATAAPADSVLELALALSSQHNPGDLPRAIALLEPITRSSAPELAPWQPLARLLLGRVQEQRRLEDQVAREVAQRREQQRTLQQLNEKLEALKAIERSMTTRLPGVGAAAGAPPASGSAAPKSP